MHQSERDFAKKNAKKFAQYYKDQTGQTIDDVRAEQLLLGNGYRLVDAAASKGPGVAGPAGDGVAVSFLAQQGGNLFQATAAQRNDPGQLGEALTPEQAALPAAKGNPALGLGLAATLATGGLSNAGVSFIKIGTDAWTAYKAASATYSMGTALGTGAAVGGTSYLGGVLGSSIYDQFYGTGQSIYSGFNQRFSYPALASSMTMGGGNWHVWHSHVRVGRCTQYTKKLDNVTWICNSR